MLQLSFIYKIGIRLDLAQESVVCSPLTSNNIWIDSNPYGLDRCTIIPYLFIECIHIHCLIFHNLGLGEAYYPIHYTDIDTKCFPV